MTLKSPLCFEKQLQGSAQPAPVYLPPTPPDGTVVKLLYLILEKVRNYVFGGGFR